jgi:hypothetical protein
LAHLDTVNPQPPDPPSEPSQEPASSATPVAPAQPPQGWFSDPFESREVRKARERADRAARRADRAAQRVYRAQQRSADRSGARQLVDVAGDAATAALTAVSAVADEAQAKLAAKARMRELENAVITARAGRPVDVSPPSHEEALKLADRVDPGSPGASFFRGIGFILAGIAAVAMIVIGGFGWLGVAVPLGILIAGSSMGNRVQLEDRNRKAGRIQLELARASIASTGTAAITSGTSAVSPPLAAAPVNQQRRLVESGNPRTRSEVLAVLDRLVVNVRGLVPDPTMATLEKIREAAALALPPTDEPLNLADHDTWQLRQICIDYLPGALERYIALPPDLASQPLLDGRSAQQVLDEQLALIQNRIDELAASSYRREANGLLSHARFIADTLRPDPFASMLDAVAVKDAGATPVAAAEPAPATETSLTTAEPAAPVRERA